MRKYTILISSKTYNKVQKVRNLCADYNIKIQDEVIIESALDILISKLEGKNGGSMED